MRLVPDELQTSPTPAIDGDATAAALREQLETAKARLAEHKAQMRALGLEASNDGRAHEIAPGD